MRLGALHRQASDFLWQGGRQLVQELFLLAPGCRLWLVLHDKKLWDGGLPHGPNAVWKSDEGLQEEHDAALDGGEGLLLAG